MSKSFSFLLEFLFIFVTPETLFFLSFFFFLSLSTRNENSKIKSGMAIKFDNPDQNKPIANRSSDSSSRVNFNPK